MIHFRNAINNKITGWYMMNTKLIPDSPEPVNFNALIDNDANIPANKHTVENMPAR